MEDALVGRFTEDLHMSNSRSLECWMSGLRCEMIVNRDAAAVVKDVVWKYGFILWCLIELNI